MPVFSRGATCAQFGLRPGDLGSSLGTGLMSEHRLACPGRLYLPQDAC